MRDVLRVWEEGQATLFLISDARGGAGRRFERHADALHVLDEAGTLLVNLALNADEWAVLTQGRAHWLECHAQQLQLSVIIEFARSGTTA